jgi:RND family efflux transporter MFP subunit
MTTSKKILGAAIVALAAGLSIQAGLTNAADARSANEVLTQGTTTPSDTRKLGFDIRGVVGEVTVKKGDVVRAGSKLMSLVDHEERAQLLAAQRRADVSRDIAEAEAQLKLRRVDLARKQEMFNRGGSITSFELESAQAEADVAGARVEQAKHAGQVSLAQAEAQESRVKRMNMFVPADVEGDVIVRDVIVKSGENVDESRPVIEVIDLDPLYIEVKLLETAKVESLSVGQSLQVRYAGEDGWTPAKINFIDPQADARAGTRSFRMEMPNPQKRAAGLLVEIRVP